MLVELKDKPHIRGFRDPLWCCDPTQGLIYLGLLMYAIAFTGSLLDLPTKWAWLAPAPLLVLVVVRSFERLRDWRTTIPASTDLGGAAKGAAKIAGRRVQVLRALKVPGSLPPEGRWFRTGPREDQQAALLAMVLAVPPILRFIADVGVSFED